MKIEEFKACLQNGMSFKKTANLVGMTPKEATLWLEENGQLDEVKAAMSKVVLAAVAHTSKKLATSDFDGFLKKRKMFAQKIAVSYDLGFFGAGGNFYSGLPDPRVAAQIIKDGNYHPDDIPAVLCMDDKKFLEYLTKYPNLQLFINDKQRH